jgi:hypothetical protein
VPATRTMHVESRERRALPSAGSRGAVRASVLPAGGGGVPGLWGAVARLRARAMRWLRPRRPGGVLLQGTRHAKAVKLLPAEEAGIRGLSDMLRMYCPSRGAARMVHTAAWLCDAVIPEVPVWQWALSLPYRVRTQCAYDTEAGALVRGVLMRAGSGFHEGTAKRWGVPRPRAGAWRSFSASIRGCGTPRTHQSAGRRTSSSATFAAEIATVPRVIHRGSRGSALPIRFCHSCCCAVGSCSRFGSTRRA